MTNDENVDAARKMVKGTRSLWWGTSNKALDRAAQELKAALSADAPQPRDPADPATLLRSYRNTLVLVLIALPLGCATVATTGIVSVAFRIAFAVAVGLSVASSMILFHELRRVTGERWAFWRYNR